MSTTTYVAIHRATSHGKGCGSTEFSHHHPLQVIKQAVKQHGCGSQSYSIYAMPHLADFKTEDLESDEG